MFKVSLKCRNLDKEALWVVRACEHLHCQRASAQLTQGQPCLPHPPPLTLNHHQPQPSWRFFLVSQQFKTNFFRPSSPFFNSTLLWWALFWQILLTFDTWTLSVGAPNALQWGATFGSTQWVANTIPDRDLLLSAICGWWHFKDWVKLWKT